MNDVAALIEELGDSLPIGAGDPGAGVTLGVTDVVLELPIEGRILDDAVLHVSLPRGRLATGFSTPHGRLRLTFVRGER